MKTLMNINSAAIKNTLTVSGIDSKINVRVFLPKSSITEQEHCTGPVVSSVHTQGDNPLGWKDSYLVLFHQTTSGQRLKIQFKALVLPQIVTDRAGSSFHAVSLCLYSFSG